MSWLCDCLFLRIWAVWRRRGWLDASGTVGVLQPWPPPPPISLVPAGSCSTWMFSCSICQGRSEVIFNASQLYPSMCHAAVCGVSVRTDVRDQPCGFCSWENHKSRYTSVRSEMKWQTKKTRKEKTIYLFGHPQEWLHLWKIIMRYEMAEAARPYFLTKGCSNCIAITYCHGLISISNIIVLINTSLLLLLHSSCYVCCTKIPWLRWWFPM